MHIDTSGVVKLYKLRYLVFCQTEEIEASLDKTWVVNSQSAAQKILLAEQPPSEPLVVRGPYTVYLKDQVVTYFLLLGKTRPEPIDDTDPDGKIITFIPST